MAIGRYTMRNDDDFVSDGFLLVAAGLVVLCSSLLAIALI
jgi:hypothetical protein